MCLTAPNNPRLQTAKAPIVVFKWLLKRKGRLESPFRYKEYKRGGTYRIKSLRLDTQYGKNVVNRGFHAYRLKRSKEYYRFIIPKGAKYLISKDQEQIVSDKIHFPRIKKRSRK